MWLSIDSNSSQSLAIQVLDIGNEDLFPISKIFTQTERYYIIAKLFLFDFFWV